MGSAIGKFVARVAGSAILYSFARGALLWLATKDIYPAEWVVNGFGWAEHTLMSSQAASWLILGFAGFLGLFFGPLLYAAGQKFAPIFGIQTNYKPSFGRKFMSLQDAAVITHEAIQHTPKACFEEHVAAQDGTTTHNYFGNALAKENDERHIAAIEMFGVDKRFNKFVQIPPEQNRYGKIRNEASELVCDYPVIKEYADVQIKRKDFKRRLKQVVKDFEEIDNGDG